MAGDADGNIIASIISHHMKTSAPNGGAIASIVAGPPSPEPVATNHQLSATSSAIPAATTSRSWRRIRPVRSAADDPMARQVQIGELAVAVAELDMHRSARRPARRAADIGDR